MADGISGAMREREKENRVPELIEQISRKLLNMSAMISETVNSVYDDLGEKTKKILLDYCEEQIAQAQHLVEQTVQAAGKNAEEKAAMEEVTEKARNVLNKVREAL